MNEKKTAIRKKMLKKRGLLSPEEKAKKDRLICDKIEKAPFFKNAKTILFYYPIKNEVSLLSLIEKYINDKNILLPITKNNANIKLGKIHTLEELTPGKFNIPEPKKENKNYKPEIILIPGLAFDKKLNRIGFGKGFFDNFLENHPAKKIAIAYDFQIIDSLPVEKHDQKMDIIISEKNIYK